MKRLPKASLAAFAACALVLAACGDDDDDAPSDDTTEEGDSETTDAPSDDTDAPSDDTDPPSDDTGDSEGTLPEDATELAIQILVDNLGLTEDQASCLVEAMGPESLASGETPDVQEMMGFLEDCDIELTDLQPGG
jgi:hypothetical protein